MTRYTDPHHGKLDDSILKDKTTRQHMWYYLYKPEHRQYFLDLCKERDHLAREMITYEQVKVDEEGYLFWTTCGDKVKDL